MDKDLYIKIVDRVNSILKSRGIIGSLFFHLIDFTIEQEKKFLSYDIGWLRLSHFAKIHHILGEEVVRINRDIHNEK